jgi:hypothetical protein
MLLRGSKFSGGADWDWTISNAESNLGADQNGLRAEFVQLCKTARRMTPTAEPSQILDGSGGEQ